MTPSLSLQPRIEQRPALRLVGTICDYAFADGDMLRALPMQWAAFGALIPMPPDGGRADQLRRRPAHRGSRLLSLHDRLSARAG